MNDPHGPAGGASGEHSDRDPERIPTQAELDAEDLAALARSSRDRDHDTLYPPRPTDPGPPPAALALHARVVWWGAAVIGLILTVYGFLEFGTITDDLRQRLLDGIANDPVNSAPQDEVDSLAGFFPPVMLVAIVLILAIEYPLLVAAATHHSRSCRNFFVAVCVVHLLCVPIGIDLLFRYPDIPSAMVVLGWLQFALVLVSALLTLRRPVNRWLPESTRMRPSRVFRGR
ncbi:hypothetical protein [Gordonia aurantiaca]|uniref:hypothetical protein n=1 Tax=Gordonia sp. B21 TaxID=3151852 RepID=UPI0032658699